MNNYKADSQSIGDWNGKEDEAIELWNTYIAPVLDSLYESYDGGYTQQWAFDQFCGLVDLDESDGVEVVRDIVKGICSKSETPLHNLPI